MRNNFQSISKPRFTPSEGVGGTWVDPKTKEKWTYTTQGWVKDTKNDSFNIRPDEEPFAQELRGHGIDEEQIIAGLSERRRVLSNLESQQELNPNTNTGDVVEPTNPFNGMTKQEVLRDAFNKGVTDLGELEKLETLYDKLVGEDDVPISDFSNMSPEQQTAQKEQIKQLVALKARDLGSAGERDGVLGTLATFETGQEIIDTLNRGDVETGFFKGMIRRGVFGIGTRTFGGTSPEEDYFNALTEIFAANFRKALSGVSVNPEEMKRMEQFLPSETKTAQANIEGVRALSNYLSEKTSLMVDTDLDPLKPRTETQEDDPLEIFSVGTGTNPLGI